MAKFSEGTRAILASAITDTRLPEPWSTLQIVRDELRVSTAPSTNRGVENTIKGIEFKCDYLSLTIHEHFANVFDDIIHLLLVNSNIHDFHWSELFHNPGHGGRGYRSIWVSALGITLYAMPINKEQNHCHIEIKGTALEYMGQGRLVNFMQVLNQKYKKWNCTRFDGAYDHSKITPYMMQTAADNEQLRTKSRNYRMEVSSDGVDKSATHYVGNRQKGSLRILRVYDMRGYNRVELELRKERADQVAKDLLKQDAENWPVRFLEHLRDFIDVIDTQTGGGNRSRAALVEYWSEFVNGAGKAAMRLEAEEQTLERSKQWVEHSVVTTLGMLLDSNYVDADWLTDWIEKGRSKMSARQRLLSRTYKSQQEFLPQHDKNYNCGDIMDHVIIM